MTEQELDARYDKIVAEHPDGITKEQFVRIALESADEDGRVYPHPVRSDCMFQILFWMAMEGLVRWGRHDQPIIPNLRITDKGREWIAANSPPPKPGS